MNPLAIETEGAQRLLDALRRIYRETPPPDAEFDAALAANRFFLGFYSRWEGVSLENLAETIRRCTQPDWQPQGYVLAGLREGFRQAAADSALLQTRLDFWKTVDASALAGRALPHLPPGTPLRSTVHLTIDAFNGGFAYNDEIGLSLLRDITNPGFYEPMLAHELHHVGFRYWVLRDPLRQALAGEESGRAMAVAHVQDLLSEGLAIHYCSPYPPMPEETTAAPDGPPERIRARFAKFRREEAALFTQSAEVLRLCLTPGADVRTCRQAVEAFAIDPEGVEPIGHYVGARMVAIMSQAHSHERIVGCVQSLADFLPLYNQAARQSGAYLYDPELVEQFCQMWNI
jgi:hypothetical protein